VAAADDLELAAAAAGVMLVGFAEGLGAAKTYAARHHHEVDANRELVGLVADAPTSGTHIVGVEFTKERAGEHHEPDGPMKLHVDDRVVATDEFQTIASRYSLCGEGLCIGYDGGDAAWPTTSAAPTCTAAWRTPSATPQPDESVGGSGSRRTSSSSRPRAWMRSSSPYRAAWSWTGPCSTVPTGSTDAFMPSKAATSESLRRPLTRIS
jgi:hypothetical protein